MGTKKQKVEADISADLKDVEVFEDVEVVIDPVDDTEPQDSGSSPDVAAVQGLAEALESTRQQLLRVHADFDNFRKRTRQEKEDLQQFATKRLLADILPVVDNLDRALTTSQEHSGDEFRSGIEMVRRQLDTVLDQYGVKAMDVIGEPFDPNFHEAVMQEPASDGDAGAIVMELQKGYLLHDKVLRPAMVKVTV